MAEFTGWLYDETQPDNKGQQFDASVGDPVKFVLGGGQVIPGWDQGLVGMREGGERQLIVPSALAFGATRVGLIPPNSALVFDVTLVSVFVPPSSLVVLDLVPGAGAAAANGDTLTVEFVGWVYDPTQPDNKGVVFDATNGASFAFVLGAGTVTTGWERGLVGMRVGGERRLTIPPDLGFGGVATGLIPPNSTILFDVELLSVE